MRKMRSILIFIVAVVLVMTALSCGKKPTEPEITPIEMIHVPGGTFTMGATKAPWHEEVILTPHTVTLNAFYIGKYEVTQAEFSRFMQPRLEWIEELGRGANYPAYGITWYDAIKYCNLRSMAEKLTPCYEIDGSTNPAHWGEAPTKWEDPETPIWDAVFCNFKANGYRLPTEAEWEYAARGATNDPDYLYSGSDDIHSVAWNTENAGGSYQPVGTKAPNGIGTYDMSGNTHEWCWDWYGKYYYNYCPQENPIGPETGNARIMRGGDINYDCYVSLRSASFPYFEWSGLRLCRSKVD